MNTVSASQIKTPGRTILQMHPALQKHAGFQRLFQPNTLTLGLILPLETHRTPAPTMADHIAMAQRAESLGFGALWLRDVPFYDPNYGDVAQIFEPMVYMAYLAAATQRIALGSAALVLPTREPMYLAKQATSIDQLSEGRLILGLSAGDRESDYPMLNVDYDSRGERYRDAWSVFRQLSEESFPNFHSERFGGSSGVLDLVPKPLHGRVPSIAVGRAQQNLDWLAQNADGFLTFAPSIARVRSVALDWQNQVRKAVGEDCFKPFGLGGFLDLAADPDLPYQRIPGGFRAGRNGLIEYLNSARNAGAAHMALNPHISRQPYTEILDELAEYVLPHFPSHPIPEKQ